jgi:hypothetical protein
MSSNVFARGRCANKLLSLSVSPSQALRVQANAEMADRHQEQHLAQVRRTTQLAQP